LYGTLCCEKKLNDTILAMKNTQNKKLEWFCKSMVSVSNFFVSSDIKIAIIGTVGAGKSTILRRFLNRVLPYHGMDYSKERMKFKDYTVEFWDFNTVKDKSVLGWKSQLIEFHAVMFVIDSSDPPTIFAAGKAVQDIGVAGLLEDRPLLVFVNKRDAPNSLTTLQVIIKMNLHNLFCKKGWHVQGCSAREGYGLEEGLNWIIDKFQSEEIERLQNKLK